MAYERSVSSSSRATLYRSSTGSEEGTVVARRPAACWRARDGPSLMVGPGAAASGGAAAGSAVAGSAAGAASGGAAAGGGARQTSGSTIQP